MSAHAFGFLKIGIATGRHAAAVGGAQVQELYEEDTVEGRARRAALIALGKCCIAFRIGHDVSERAEAVEQLVPVLESAVNRYGKRLVPFPEIWLYCIAAAAIDEATLDMCEPCGGAGQVKLAKDMEGRQPMITCPSCHGRRTRRYNEDDRVQKLAREWVRRFEKKEPSERDVASVARELRRSSHRDDLIRGIDYAVGRVRVSEHVAAKEVARMLDLWVPISGA